MKKAVSYLIVVLVSFVMALNYQLFVFPNSFAPAGLNGIFTMIQYALGFKLIHKRKPNVNFFYIIFVLNIAVAIASYFVYDYKIEPDCFVTVSHVDAVIGKFPALTKDGNPEKLPYDTIH